MAGPRENRVFRIARIDLASKGVGDSPRCCGVAPGGAQRDHRQPIATRAQMKSIPASWFEEAAALAESSDYNVRIVLLRSSFLISASEKSGGSDRASAGGEVTLADLYGADLNPFPKAIRDVERRLASRVAS